MGYSIDWSDLEQRIQDQKAALLDTSQNMDPERLKFLVETYDECKGESVFITRAKLFEKVLNNKKIYLDGNPIVGSLAGGRAMIYAYRNGSATGSRTTLIRKSWPCPLSAKCASPTKPRKS